MVVEEKKGHINYSFNSLPPFLFITTPFTPKQLVQLPPKHHSNPLSSQGSSEETIEKRSSSSVNTSAWTQVVLEGESRTGLQLARTGSDKNLDLLRPSSRYFSIFKGQAVDSADHEKGKYTLIKDSDEFTGLYDKPLPCFGCGIGWFSFLLGFLCPLLWFYATILYLGNYYRKDPRERAGLAASAIAAMASLVILMIVLVILFV